MSDQRSGPEADTEDDGIPEAITASPSDSHCIVGAQRITHPIKLRHHRIDTRVRVQVPVRLMIRGREVVAETSDMSAGGLFVCTDVFAPIGDLVPVQLALAEDQATHEIISRVTHSVDAVDARKYGRLRGMGLFFADVDGQLPEDVFGAFLESASDYVASRPVRVVSSQILFASADSASRERHKIYLREGGHDVRTVESGLDLVCRVVRSPPDLIVADLGLPELDGWALCELARARPSLSQIPLVITAGEVEVEDRVSLYRLGARDVICGDMDPAGLARRVKRVLERTQVFPREVHAAAALRGSLRHIPMRTLLEHLEFHERSGRLMVARDQHLIHLDMATGRVLRIRGGGTEDQAPADAIRELLDLDHGVYEFALVDVDVDGEDEVELTVSQLLGR